jgi:peroxiredoxin
LKGSSNTITSERKKAMRPDIIPGACFPDYELTDHTRTRRKLSELQGADPLILLLARGHFCPKEHQQHLELAAFYPKVAVAYTRIVTITTDNILELNEVRDSVGATWTFLADPRRVVQKDLDIQEYSDPHHDPMIPHTFVLAPGLVIYSMYNGYWFWGRPSPEELRRDLRAAAENIIPSSSGAAKALGFIWPGLKITGKAYRVPVRTGSIAELNLVTKRPVTVDEVNAAFRKAAETAPLKGVMAVLEDEWASSRIVGDPHSSIVDLPLTAVQEGTLLSVAAWYDNEMGFSTKSGQDGSAHRRVGKPPTRGSPSRKPGRSETHSRDALPATLADAAE